MRVLMELYWFSLVLVCGYNLSAGPKLGAIPLSTDSFWIVWELCRPVAALLRIPRVANGSQLQYGRSV